MRDYALLAKSLRHCAENGLCSDCPMYDDCPDLDGRKNAADAIEKLLAAVPKRGEWLITDAYPHRVYCSVCYKTYLPNADWELWSDGRIPRNFCPHCGAKMEVSEDA